eukprot:365282-Chlamydomonas_euryale.AAC.1
MCLVPGEVCIRMHTHRLVCAHGRRPGVCVRRNVPRNVLRLVDAWVESGCVAVTITELCECGDLLSQLRARCDAQRPFEEVHLQDMIVQVWEHTGVTATWSKRTSVQPWMRNFVCEVCAACSQAAASPDAATDTVHTAAMTTQHCRLVPASVRHLLVPACIWPLPIPVSIGHLKVTGSIRHLMPWIQHPGTSTLPAPRVLNPESWFQIHQAPDALAPSSRFQHPSSTSRPGSRILVPDPSGT